MVDASFLAHIAVAKFCDHLPLYRQAEIYARSGLDIDRSQLAEWLGHVAWLLRPLGRADRRARDGRPRDPRRRHAGAGARTGSGQDQDRPAVGLSARRATACRTCPARRALSLHARPQRRALPQPSSPTSPAGCMPMAMRASAGCTRSRARTARRCPCMGPRALPRSAAGRMFGAASSTSTSRTDRRSRKRRSTRSVRCSTSSG